MWRNPHEPRERLPVSWMRTVATCTDVSGIRLTDSNRRRQSRDSHCCKSRLNLPRIDIFIRPRRFGRGTPGPFRGFVASLGFGMSTSGFGTPSCFSTNFSKFNQLSSGDFSSALRAMPSLTSRRTSTWTDFVWVNCGFHVKDELLAPPFASPPLRETCR